MLRDTLLHGLWSDDDLKAEAKNAGADVVGGEELITAVNDQSVYEKPSCCCLASNDSYTHHQCICDIIAEALCIFAFSFLPWHTVLLETFTGVPFSG